jgi:hypothetical protein
MAASAGTKSSEGFDREFMPAHLSILALGAAGALAACASPDAGQGRVDWLGPDRHRIVVSAEGFEQAAQLRVGYADAWQTEEYALFEAGGRRLELVFAEARKTFTVALEYEKPIAAMVPTWNANADQDLAWGPVGRYDWRPGVWFYRTFQAGESGRPCVGLQVEWGQIGADPANRPRRVLFGYACAAAGETLAGEKVRALIRGISIRSFEGKLRWRFGGRRGSGGTLATAAARGDGADGQSGHPGFPFTFARYYSESGGGRKR